MEYKTTEYHSLTKETIERAANSEEIAEIEKYQAKVDAREQAEQARAEAKLVAQAKLAALGLTVEDLQALGL